MDIARHIVEREQYLIVRQMSQQRGTERIGVQHSLHTEPAQVGKRQAEIPYIASHASQRTVTIEIDRQRAGRK